jgi:23S rRNA pseudouridine1911/1915/1917 synthase
VDLAKAWIKERYAKPGRVFIGMVHRLDAPVAGVVAMARTSKAAARLSEQFRQGRVTKTYLAVVQGRPPRENGRLVHHLVRKGRYSRPATSATAGSREAALTYRLLETGGQTSLLAIDLETGRRHQIRAQLAAMGCPIVGDRAYGGTRALPHGRIGLMAHRLVVAHPTRNTPVTVECPCPRDWPWAPETVQPDAPLWGIEDYEVEGLDLSSILSNGMKNAPIL